MYQRLPVRWKSFFTIRPVYIFLILTVGAGGVVAQEIAPLPLIETCRGRQSQPQTPQLIEQIAKSAGDEKSLINLIEQLGKSCDTDAIDPLIAQLNNPSPRVRIAAIEGLGRSGDQLAYEPLFNILLTESDEVRPAIIRSMLSLQIHQSRAAVLNMYTHPLANPVKGPADMRLRGVAILTFNELNNTQYNAKAIGFLHSFMNSDQPEIVNIASEILTRLPKTRHGAREMIGIVKNNHIPMIRIWMCEWLGRLKVGEARAVLEQTAASDSDQKMRVAAAEALKRLGN